jgi:mannose-1-phosphate guanylyltransferase
VGVYAVVLAGGGGTRLWPLSRPDRPKPFLAPLGGDSLLRRTVDRLAPLVDQADVLVVTDARYADLVREQLPALPAGNLVGEPAGRNTAAAIALAAVAIDRPDDDVMLILPADHLVIDEAGFRAVLETAAAAAEGGAGAPDPLVTLGIRPTGPETGYGYIVAGPSSAAAGVPPTPSSAAVTAAASRVRPVLRFVEKPDVPAAEALLAGDPPAAWNAGIFVWRRRAIHSALDRHAGDIVGTVADGWSAERAGRAGALAAAYDLVRRTSIDYAVMEPAAAAGRVLVVPADVGWSDLGSWSAIRDALVARGRATAAPGDEPPGTVGAGPRRDVDSVDTLVLADGRLVVTIGLRDTIVVDTPDALLVCAADRSQEVRSIAEELARRAVEEGT